MTGPPASSGTAWAAAGGAGSPHHTHTHSHQSQLLPPPAAVSTHKCQHSWQGSEPCCWWSPAGPAEARAGAQGEPRACTPSLTAGRGELTSGICPRVGLPHLLLVKSTRKKRGARRRAFLAQGVSVAGGAAPTWQEEPCAHHGRWKDATGSDATPRVTGHS